MSKIDYILERKPVKRINLRVRKDGSVYVSAPPRVPKSELDQFVEAHRTWIAHAQAKIAASPMRIAEQATKEEQAEWRAIVEGVTPGIVAIWEKRLGVQAKRLTYRNMRSQWGSCQPKTGRICINTRLALYPPKCLEYVIVHELCHLKVHGHGPKFWKLVESALPDYRERMALLKE